MNIKTTSDQMIRDAALKDAKEIAEIYNHYILNTTVTFEEKPVNSDAMWERVLACTEKWPWLVCLEGESIIGYAYAVDWKPREAYKHSVECSVYLRHGEEGKGVGTRLYAALLEELSRLEVHAIIGGITLPNDSSVEFHEKFGFKKIAHFEEVGFKFGKWLDVGYWELLLGEK